ncbi:MAG TPA: hypothetical protein VNE21_03615 [Mycobacteriales bacterium]|nr:hypothetical protein [Mycobacteriales bacterium]
MDDVSAPLYEVSTLEEIDVLGEVMAVASGCPEKLSMSQIDAALGLPAPRSESDSDGE